VAVDTPSEEHVAATWGMLFWERGVASGEWGTGILKFLGKNKKKYEKVNKYLTKNLVNYRRRVRKINVKLDEISKKLYFQID